MRERGFEVGDAGQEDGVRLMMMVGGGASDSFQGQPPVIVFLMATVTGMMVRTIHSPHRRPSRLPRLTDEERCRILAVAADIPTLWLALGA